MKSNTPDAAHWIPRPIDLTGIQLTEDLLQLAEQLAENIHDVWAQERMQAGWRYGPERSDARRETPCLVPYAELPDSERVYDRAVATQTLKQILYFGYEIKPATE